MPVKYKRNIARRMALCALGLLALAACRKDRENAPGLNNPDLAFEVRYETEAVSRQEIVGAAGGKPDFMDENRAAPIASRSSTVITVFKDGSSEWVIRQLIPHAQIPSVRREVPADDSRKKVETRISRSGLSSHYDKDGGLIRTVQMEPVSFKQEVDALRSKGKTDASARILNLNMDTDALLAQARQQGAVVNTLGNGLMSIRTASAKNSSARTTGGSNLSEVSIFNPTLKLILGSTVYDNDEKVAEIFYKYKLETGKDPQVEVIHQKTYRTMESGKQVVTITNTTIDNLQVINNLN